METGLGLPGFISWSGLDIGRDCGSPGSHYAAPFGFTGNLIHVAGVYKVSRSHACRDGELPSNIEKPGANLQWVMFVARRRGLPQSSVRQKELADRPFANLVGNPGAVGFAARMHL